MTLAKDHGRLAKPHQIFRFMKAQAHETQHSLSVRLGLKKLEQAIPDDWKAPDSQLARKADQMAKTVCSELLYLHCQRTYAFGAILAARYNLKIDQEVFFVASLLHDLGLSEQHATDEGSFEWVSARLAHQFALSNSVSDERAELIHNAVALHSSAGIAGTQCPEIAMTHFGAGVDLFGMRIDDIPKVALMSVLENYPRTDFKCGFSECLKHQADIKPESYIAGPVDLGLCDRMTTHL